MDQDKQWLLQEKYHGEETASFFADCKRLEADEPVAYVIGWVPFLNCKIWLDSHPLIPRPETEWWVEKAIEEIRHRVKASETFALANPPQQPGPGQGPGKDNTHDSSTIAVLDLCAGSGCIGVAVGKLVPEARVTFAEVDPVHLPTIEKNCRQNLPQTPYKWNMWESDLFEQVTGKFDFILSNPPYIDPALDRTETSVKTFEPHKALYGGCGGSEIIEQIIATAPVFLKPGGELWLEHEPEQVIEIITAATHHDFAISTHRDQYAVERYSRLVLK